MSIRRIVILASLAIVPACIDNDDELSTTSAAVGRPCAELVCGNTNAFGVYAFYELDERALEYSAVGGMRIKSFKTSANAKMTVVVDGDLLHGRIGNTFIDGPALLHSKLLIESNLTTTQYQVEIQDIQSVSYVDDGSADMVTIPTYKLTVIELYADGSYGPTVSYCGDDINGNPKLAIVSQGDRYDPATARVTATGALAGSWFNIACYDDAIWKTTVMRYHHPGSTGDYVTSGTERTAMMESVRADYCHTGHSYTHAGVWLEWANDQAWLTNDGAPNLEAVWGGNGALCLNDPRDTEHYVRDDVACHGRIPTCDELGWTSFADGGYLATYSW